MHDYKLNKYLEEETHSSTKQKSEKYLDLFSAGQ